MARGLRTPIIKPRTQGGTFYTFASAMEDIGVNINESNNKIALSHYVLLDIPEFSGDSNMTGDEVFAALLQNYALNMETCLRNREDYNFADYKTVSEKVFWKFMLKYFFGSQQYSSLSDIEKLQSISKAFGSISAGAQRSDAFGLYNETFVQVPSSFGPMNVLFEKTKDINFLTVGSSNNGLLEGANSSNDGQALFDNNNNYDVDSDGGYSVILDLNKLRDEYDDEELTYDSLAMDVDMPEAYQFNAVLVYYSIFDNEDIVATNAYGILLPNSAVAGSSSNTWKFPSVEKRKTSAGRIGNSYSFRLNVKTSSVYSDSLIINDNSTAAYEMSTEFTDVIKNLSKAIELLQSNANVIKVLSSEHSSLKGFAASIASKAEDLEKDITVLKQDKSLSKFANLTADVINTNVLRANEITLHNVSMTEEEEFISLQDYIDDKLSVIHSLTDSISTLQSSINNLQEEINEMKAPLSEDTEEQEDI